MQRVSASGDQSALVGGRQMPGLGLRGREMEAGAVEGLESPHAVKIAFGFAIELAVGERFRVEHQAAEFRISSDGSTDILAGLAGNDERQIVRIAGGEDKRRAFDSEDRLGLSNAIGLFRIDGAKGRRAAPPPLAAGQ